MTVREVIAAIKTMKPSQYDDKTLARWLGELEGRLHEDVLQYYGEPGRVPPLPITPEEGDRLLQVPFPHEDLYAQWLAAKIDFQNGEIERYANSMVMFNASYQAFVDSYNRANMPRQDSCVTF